MITKFGNDTLTISFNIIYRINNCIPSNMRYESNNICLELVTCVLYKEYKLSQTHHFRRYIFVNLSHIMYNISSPLQRSKFTLPFT